MSSETFGEINRRLPVGAEPWREGTHFRVWAPDRQQVDVVVEGTNITGAFPLKREEEGYFSGSVAGAGPGDRYHFLLDNEGPFPDPASRFQPEGPHGPSMIVDSSAFPWTDDGWSGPEIAGQVVYEMHIGTFTAEGSWAAAEALLPDLADIGITTIELMPVADFPGSFGWGYDGVDLFAPTRLYGEPDSFRRFVNTAHSLRIAVILDVVYNHLGPSGNYLPRFSEQYFTDRYVNEWGDPVNFDGPGAGPVREFFISNAIYWLREYHLDGLRLDATQQIFDSSEDNIVAMITRAVLEVAAEMGRSAIIVGENEPQEVRYIRSPDDGGYGLSALWNDDFHHSARVALTGYREAYYSPYRGTAQELVSCAKYGFLYQGQSYFWMERRRGTSTRGFPRNRFVEYIENHDQVANTATGERLHQQCDPGCYRAITALLLFGPGTPMLFQGQEYSSTRPFLYFADQEEELARVVRKGRLEFLRQFRSIDRNPEVQAAIADPADPETFKRSKLDPAERERNVEARALHRDLLRLRREDPVIALQAGLGIDGAVLADDVFVIRFFGSEGEDRLLLVNLGEDIKLEVLSEPLLAPPAGRVWREAWSSNRAEYGGSGEPSVSIRDGWHITGGTAALFAPGARLSQWETPVGAATDPESRP
ncbi:MAG: malto-oligosyltrehalose trehalohydrolase [Gemmatimonadota bacterium]|jgi:maltooligosyltrehalose trehalohydrolase|nr:malto-oligosyltrehalose trehalohydrolase [Gemmatimonadota bacterium]